MKRFATAREIENRRTPTKKLVSARISAKALDILTDESKKLSLPQASKFKKGKKPQISKLVGGILEEYADWVLKQK